MDTPMQSSDNGYIAFYNGKQHELRAPTLFEAKEAAVKHFNPPKSKRHLVHVELAELNNQQVTTVITS